MKKTYLYWPLLPGLLFLAVFMVIPIVLTIGSTFVQNSSFTLEGYLHFFKDPYFLKILLTTLEVSVVTTLVCVLLGFPTAYYISQKAPRRKGILLALAIFPLLTSPVVRSFSWMVILGRKGLLNNVLIGLGLVDEPLNILYTPAAMIIGLVHLFLPLMIISLIGVLENIDGDLVHAAQSLGASRFSAFRKIVFPLSVPGLIIGSILVFVGDPDCIYDTSTTWRKTAGYRYIFVSERDDAKRLVFSFCYCNNYDCYYIYRGRSLK